MADLSKELNKELSKDFAYCEDALGRAENAIGNLPSVQPEKRTEKRTKTHACDLIDREAAVDAIYHHLPSVSRTRARTMLHEVPSAQPEQEVEPERKTGKWNGYNADNPDWLRDDGSPVFLTCSECHGAVMNNGSAHWNFCPNCGAKMRGWTG